VLAEQNLKDNLDEYRRDFMDSIISSEMDEFVEGLEDLVNDDTAFSELNNDQIMALLRATERGDDKTTPPEFKARISKCLEKIRKEAKRRDLVKKYREEMRKKHEEDQAKLEQYQRERRETVNLIDRARAEHNDREVDRLSQNIRVIDDNISNVSRSIAATNERMEQIGDISRSNSSNALERDRQLVEHINQLSSAVSSLDPYRIPSFRLFLG
jgi:hypothetical protein